MAWLLEDAFVGPVPHDDFLTAPRNALPPAGGAAIVAEWTWLRDGDYGRIWLSRMHAQAHLLRQPPAGPTVGLVKEGLSWPEKHR